MSANLDNAIKKNLTDLAVSHCVAADTYVDSAFRHMKGLVKGDGEPDLVAAMKAAKQAERYLLQMRRNIRNLRRMK